MSIQPSHEETLSQAVARRIRGQLAERRISGSKLSRLMGMSQQGMSRRINGLQAWTLDEIEHLEAVTGISAFYVLTGNERTPPPSGEGVYPFRVHPPGLEPGTHWLTSEAPGEADVIAFPQQPADAPEAPEEDLARVIPLARAREAATEAPSAAVVPIRKAAL